MDAPAARPLYNREGTIFLALFLAIIAPTASIFLMGILGPSPFLLDRENMEKYAGKARVRQEANVELHLLENHSKASVAARTFADNKAKSSYIKTMGEHRYIRDDNGHYEMVISIEEAVVRVEGRDRTHVKQVFDDLPFVMANPQQNVIWTLLTRHMHWFLAGMAAYVLLLTLIFSRWHSRANTVPCATGASPLSVESLRGKLLELSDPERPFEVSELGNGRILARWKIADVQWREILYKGELKVLHTVVLDFDEKHHTVRATQSSRKFHYGKGWAGAVASIAWSRSVGFAYESAASFGFLQSDEGLRPAKAYAYRYIPAEITQPMAQLVIENGWRFKPVYTFFRLLGG